jgi:hypothetical protein
LIAHEHELPFRSKRETSFATPGGAPRGLWRSRPGYTGAEAARCGLEVEIMSHPSYEYHEHDPEPSSGLTGYAAIKYTAIVIIVLAMLAFLAW